MHQLTILLLLLFNIELLPQAGVTSSGQQSVDTVMTDHRFVARVARQTSCQVSSSDPFYYEHFDIEVTLTNLGPVALSLFGGDASSVELAGLSESDETRERYAGISHRSPNRIPEGPRRAVPPGESLSWHVSAAQLFRRSPDDERFRGPGAYELRAVSYRRRLATPEEVAMTGRTRTWVRLTSAPVNIEVQAPVALPPCPEEFR